MRKYLFLFLALLLSLPAVARNFTYEYEGQTITYTVIDEDAKTCMTRKGSGYDTPGNNVSGALSLPEHPIDGGSVYTLVELGYHSFYNAKELTSITIPNSVTSIGESAFTYCTSLTSITIPNSVTSIAMYAFSACSNLTSVTIGNSVTSIGMNVFANCSNLTSVTIGNSVTSIGSNAFVNCSNLTSVTIPNSIIKIGNRSFEGCTNLTKLIIEDGETDINCDKSAFEGTQIETLYIGREWTGDIGISEHLKSLTLNTKRVPARSFSRCTKLTSVVIAGSVTSVGDYAFYGCNNLTELIIEEGDNAISFYRDALGYTSIKNLYIGRNWEYFNGYNKPGPMPDPLLENLTLGNKVTTIPESAFDGCLNLSSIKISESVTEIKSKAFKGCTALASAEFSSIESICNIQFADALANPLYYANSLYIDGKQISELIIPSTVSSIKAYAFNHFSGLTSLTIDNSVKLIDKQVFENCTGLISVVIGNSVETIGKKAFQGCTNLSSVIIGKSVKYIDDYAFSGCSALTSVSLPSSLTSIGASAFIDCSTLTSIAIGNSVENIGNGAFEKCAGLSSLVIGNAVKTIGSDAFSGCDALTSISIPSSVITIGAGAFSYCPSLKNMTIEDAEKSLKFDNRTFSGTPLETIYIGRDCTFDGANLNEYNRVLMPSTLKVVTFSNLVTTIPLYTFENCSELSSLTIPNSITSIEKYAFQNCKGLRELTLEVGEKNITIADRAFYRTEIETLNLGRNWTGSIANSTSLKNLTLLNGITSIPDQAFYECSGLTSVTIPNSVTEIGKGAFFRCSNLTSFMVADGETTIFFHDNTLLYAPIDPLYMGRNWTSDKNATISTGLKSVTFGNNVTSLPDYAFSGCKSLSSVEIPTSVTSIGTSAFSGCSALTSVVIPSSVTTINSSTFSGCSALTSIEIPNSVTSINTSAFSGCSAITSIEIPNSVKTIESSAFKECARLSEINFGNSVVSIGEEVFFGCSSLSNLTLPGSVTSIGNGAFNQCTSLKDLNIADSDSTLELGYNFYNNGIENGKGLFYDCPIEKLYIGRNINYSTDNRKGFSPFYNNRYIKEAKIGDNVSIIGYRLLGLCTNLSSVKIPSSVTSIDSQAFLWCDKMTLFCIEDCQTPINIGEDAIPQNIETLYIGRDWTGNLNSLSQLNDLTIGNEVTDIPEWAFSSCTGLVSVTIPNSVKGIGQSAFSGCTNLSHVSISNSLTGINKGVFQSCSSLNNVVIPNSIATIEESAFDGCSGLTDLTFEDGDTDIIFKTRAFAGTKIENLYMGRDWSYDGKTLSSNLKTLTLGKSVKTIPQSAFSGSNQLAELTFPASIETIGKEAFKDCTGLIKTDFPSLENLLKIKFGSTTANPLFYSHLLSIAGEEVTELVIPDNITEIGSFALCGGINLSSVEIPGTVTSIGESAFEGCSGLSTVVIPGSVSAIGESAFEGCSGLSTVVIPGSVKTIGQGVFANCTGLIKSAYPSSIKNPFEYGVQICYPADGIEDSGVIYDSAKEKVFFAPLSYKGDYTSPSSVRSIGEKAFYLCEGLTSLSLAKCNINNMAFSNCEGLTSIRLTGDITFNGEAFWKDCPNIKEVYYITGKPRKADSNSFDKTVYENATLHLRESSREEAMDLTPWKLFEDVENIPSFAYEYNGQTLLYEVIDDETCLVARQRNLNGEVTIPEIAYYRGKRYKVTEISEYAFEQNNITSVSMPETIKIIKNNAFDSCNNLYSITIPNSVIEIGDEAFKNCQKFSSISIPNSVIEIGDKAFSNCRGLNKVTIGNNVKSFGNEVWSGCTSIAEIYYQSMSPVSGPDDMFESSVYEKAMLYLAEEVREEAQKLTPWCNFKHIYRLPGEEYMLIYEYEGSDAKVVGFKPDYEVDVVIPAKVTKDGVEYTVTSIANTAFKDSDLLMSIVIPETIGSIESEAFANCQLLTKVVYNASNAVCDEKAAESPIFAYCPKLTNITIGETVNSIPKYIFKSTPIRSLIIPDNVTVLDEGCFDECSELYDIAIGNGVKAIRAAAFGLNSYSDKAVTLYFNATNLEEYSGKNGDFGYGTEDLPLVNRNIKKLMFGSMVESVCAYAFNECKPERIESYNPVPPVLGVGCLESTDKDTCKLIIPEGSRKAYSLADIWMEFMNVEDTISGINDVLIDDDTTVKVYNLNGFKIYDGKLSEMTLQNGFYIIIRNGLAKKVYINE